MVHETSNSEALLLPQAKLVFPHDLAIRQRILSIKEIVEIYCGKEICHLRTTQLFSTGGIGIRKLVDQCTNDILAGSNNNAIVIVQASCNAHRMLDLTYGRCGI